MRQGESLLMYNSSTEEKVMWMLPGIDCFAVKRPIRKHILKNTHLSFGGVGMSGSVEASDVK